MMWSKIKENLLSWLLTGAFVILFALLGITYAIASESWNKACSAHSSARLNRERHEDLKEFISTQFDDVKQLIRGNK